ncbi:MAG: hypothetical protein ACFFDT_33125 [Candidatus Hodarchaeota archaeon]
MVKTKHLCQGCKVHLLNVEETPMVFPYLLVCPECKFTFVAKADPLNPKIDLRFKTTYKPKGKILPKSSRDPLRFDYREFIIWIDRKNQTARFQSQN